MSTRHPATLFSLCLIETAERFGAGLLGALLIFHLAEDLHLRPGVAAQLQAVFLSLTYGLSILGGLIADRLAGYRRTLALGLLLLGAGYTLLSWAGRFALLGGLGFLVLGQALFKPTVTAVLGTIYRREPELRAAGFAWFYFAINIAAAIAPWVGAVLRHRASWSGTMVVAAWSVTVAIGVLFFVVAKLPEPETAAADTEPSTVDATSLDTVRIRWVELGLILIVVLCFSVAYSQSQGTLLFFARDRLVRSISGYELPAEAFAALPAMLILVLKPVFDVFNRVLARRGYARRRNVTLTLGLLLTAAAFALLAGATVVSPAAKLGLGWLLGTEVLLTLAELLVMPGAMARVAELFSREHAALSQGLLFGVQAVGFFVSGLVGSLWGVVPEAWFFGGVATLPVLGLLFYLGARRWLVNHSRQ